MLVIVDLLPDVQLLLLFELEAQVERLIQPNERQVQHQIVETVPQAVVLQALFEYLIVAPQLVGLDHAQIVVGHLRSFLLPFAVNISNLCG